MEIQMKTFTSTLVKGLAVAGMVSLATMGFAQQSQMSGGMAKSMSEVPMPTKAEDGRQVVQLTEAERAMVAADMRQMLANIEAMTAGLAAGDVQAVVSAASKNGDAMMRQLPSQIRAKLPTPFAQMGAASHKAFDQIAAETKSVKNPAPVLKQMSAAMQNCVACHATYRFGNPSK
jgi:cytochrome c556